MQVVPYGRDYTNPAVAAEPAWDSRETREIAERACFDCHSNQTTWPGYARIAPGSWLIARDVTEGREHLNFSEWQRVQDHADDAAEVVREEEMPPLQYRLLHPEARLTDEERERLARGLEATVHRSQDEEGQMAVMTAIPESIQREHASIHATLVEATKASGRVGPAARALAQVLHPHFVREEEIALPPLGLLAKLTSEKVPAGAAEILPMTDALSRELPGMLAEHVQIRVAVMALREAAAADGAVRYAQLADQLALHAQTEEEVLYPAAVLVGEVVGARLAAR
jgi:mono/diheme cytochrome c family protein